MTEDLHRKRAAELFGVPEAAVTPEQRAAAKARNFADAYGATTQPHRAEEYLGDGVYASVDKAGQIELRTERETGWVSIFLERDVYEALRGYATRVWGVGS